MFCARAQRSLQIAALVVFSAAITLASGAQISDAVLRDEILHANVEPPLNEHGYQQVAALQDDNAMKDFVKRVLAGYDRYVQDEGELSGFVPHYSGTIAFQDFERLKTELMRVTWASPEKSPQGPPQPSAPAEALQPKAPPQKQQEPPQQQQEQKQQDGQRQQPRPLHPPQPDASNNYETPRRERRNHERSSSHVGASEDEHNSDHKEPGRERGEDCGGKCPRGSGQDGRHAGSDPDGRRKRSDQDSGRKGGGRNKEVGRKQPDTHQKGDVRGGQKGDGRGGQKGDGRGGQKGDGRGGQKGERRKRHAARKLTADRRMLVSALDNPNSTLSAFAAAANPSPALPEQKEQEVPQHIAQATTNQPPALQQQQQEQQAELQQAHVLQQVPSESPLPPTAETIGQPVVDPQVLPPHLEDQLPEVTADGRLLPEVDAIMGEASESMSDFASQAQFMEQQVQQRQEAIKGALNVAKERFEQKLQEMKADNKNAEASNERLRASNADLKASNIKMEGKLKNLQSAGTALMSTLQGLTAKTKNAHQFVGECINVTDDSNLDELKVLRPATPRLTLDYFLKVTYSDSATGVAVAGEDNAAKGPPAPAPASVVKPPIRSGPASSFGSMPSPEDWAKAARAQREREALSLFEKEISGSGEVSDLPQLGDGVQAASFIQLESTATEQVHVFGKGKRVGPEDLVKDLATSLVNLESASQEAHGHLKAKFIAAREAELLRASSLHSDYQSLDEEKQHALARQSELTSMRQHLVSTVRGMRERLEAFRTFASKAAETLDKSEADVFAATQRSEQNLVKPVLHATV